MSISQSGFLVVGDVMRDIIVQTEGSFRRGSDQAAKIIETFGGSAANQAVWLAALGGPVSLLARVGAQDQALLAGRFSAQGIVPLLASDQDHSTGRLIDIVEPGGARSFFTDRGANQFLQLSDVPDTVFDKVGMLALSGYALFSTSTREVVLKLMANANELNIPVAVDPASTGFIQDAGVDRFLGWIEGAQILLANAEEAQLLSGQSDVEKQMRILRQHYACVVIKQGSNGACASDGSTSLVHVAAPDVNVVDTTGAGDAFAAGFLTNYLACGELRSCLAAGVLQGSGAVGFIGGQPPENS